MTTYPNLGLTKLVEGQAGSTFTANAWLRFLDIFLMGRAVDYRTSSSAPSSPDEGDVYIIAAATPTGDWADFSQYDVAAYYDGQWIAITPHEGFHLWVNDENRFRVYDGTDWNEYIQPDG